MIHVLQDREQNFRQPDLRSNLSTLRWRRAGDLCLLAGCCSNLGLLTVKDNFRLFEIAAGILILLAHGLEQGGDD